MKDENFVSRWGEERMKEIMRSLEEVEKLGINTYTPRYPILNDIIHGLTRDLRAKSLIPSNMHVDNIWFVSNGCNFGIPHENTRIIVNLSYNDRYWEGYGIAYEQYLQNSHKAMSEKFMEVVLDAFGKMAAHVREVQEQAKNVPDVTDMWDKFIAAAQEVTNGTEFKVDVENGKLNRESENQRRDQIVVRYGDGSYRASITLSKDRNGQYHISTRVPLCGESGWEFPFDKWEENIKDAVKSVLN